MKPCECAGRWARTLVMIDIPCVPCGERGIGSKSLRYVIHTRLSKSSKKARGHVDWISASVAAAAAGGGVGEE